MCRRLLCCITCAPQHQDLQAMDRCHRIGQTKPVLVLRLATAHSVEGRMLARACGKMALERLVIKKGVFKEVLEAGAGKVRRGDWRFDCSVACCLGLDTSGCMWCKLFKEVLEAGSGTVRRQAAGVCWSCCCSGTAHRRQSCQPGCGFCMCMVLALAAEGNSTSARGHVVASG